MLPRDLVVAEVIHRVLEAHEVKLTKENDEELLARDADPNTEYEDLALRTCRCGARIDGYYEYTQHLREVSGLWRLDS